MAPGSPFQIPKDQWVIREYGKDVRIGHLVPGKMNLRLVVPDDQVNVD
jgi:hypothetical protein